MVFREFETYVLSPHDFHWAFNWHGTPCVFIADPCHLHSSLLPITRFFNTRTTRSFYALALHDLSGHFSSLIKYFNHSISIYYLPLLDMILRKCNTHISHLLNNLVSRVPELILTLAYYFLPRGCILVVTSET